MDLSAETLTLSWLQRIQGPESLLVLQMILKTWVMQSGAWGLGPGAWGLGPGAWGLGPGAWGLGLGLGPGASSLGLGTRCSKRCRVWGPVLSSRSRNSEGAEC